MSKFLRNFKYVMLFFLICGLLNLGSSYSNRMITGIYSNKILNEIKAKIENNETLYIDGAVLTSYLATSRERYELDNEYIVREGVTDKIYAYLYNNSFQVSKNNENNNNYLNIIKKDTLNTLDSDIIKDMEGLIKYKSIGVNILTVIIGVILYIKHEKYKEKAQVIVSA